MLSFWFENINVTCYFTLECLKKDNYPKFINKQVKIYMQ